MALDLDKPWSEEEQIAAFRRQGLPTRGGSNGVPEGWEIVDQPKSSNVPDGWEVVEQQQRRTPLEMAQKRPWYGDISPNPQQEAVLGLVTSPVGKAAAGMRGIGGMAIREDPQKTVAAQEALESGLTYQPRSPEGQQALSDIGSVLGFPSYLTGQAGQAVAGATGLPSLGAATDVALQAAPMALSAMARPRAVAEKGVALSDLGDRISRNLWRDESVQKALDEGFKVPPRGTLKAWTLRAAAGAPELRTKLRQANQEASDVIARREASLGQNEALSPENIAAARDKLAQPYRDLEALGKEPAKLVKKLQQAEFDARSLWDDFYAGRTRGNMDLRAAAHAADVHADRVWNQLEVSANKYGRGDLVPALRDARYKIAKNFVVQRNMIGPGLDSRGIAREYQQNRDDGRKFFPGTGLETIGRIATDPEYAEFFYPGKEQIAARLHMGVGAGLASGKLRVGGGEWFGGGIPLVRGPAARAAVSEKMQGPATTLPRYDLPGSVKLSDLLTTRPLKYLFPSLFSERPEKEP